MNKNYKNFKGWHHGYMGAIIMILGLVSVFFINRNVSAVIFIIGTIIVFDDFFQHYMQASDPEYHSPLHRLYVRMPKPKWMIKLNVWIDKIFGR